MARRISRFLPSTAAALALALLVQLCVVLQLAAAPLTSRALAVTPPPAPTSITLETNRTVIAAGESATLTATTDADVAATSTSIKILDQTANQQLKLCTTGTTCTVASSFYTGGPHTYVAQVNALVSGAVSVARAAWTISLSADGSSDGRVFPAGDAVHLTATSNQNVGSTNGKYVTRIIDQTTNQQLAYCTTGTTCTGTSRFYTGGPHTYYAVVAAVANFDVDVQATSNTLTGTRMPWTISLVADKASFTAGDSVNLTATANQNVGSTNNQFAIRIIDQTANQQVAYCATGTTCTGSKKFYTGGPHTFQATVAPVSGSGPAEATSNEVVTATRAAWSITLSSDRPVFAAGESYTLTATANQNVGNTNGQYVTRIIDQTNNNQQVAYCTTGMTCTATGRFYTGGPHTFVAVVSSVNGLDLDVQATSNTVFETRAPWTVALTSDKTVFEAGQSVTFSAATNQDLGLTNGKYVLRIIDLTANAQVAYCASGLTCSGTTKFYTGPAHQYVARIEGVGSDDVQAVSNAIVINRAAWTVTLDSSKSVVAAGVSTTLTATANQDVGLTGNTQTKYYSIQFFDYTNGLNLGRCTTGTTCSITVTAPTGYPHSYLAYVAQYTPSAATPPDVQASSNGFTAPNALTGPTLPGEVTGGSNPSENCSQRCHGDPVNSVTGEFFENATDLAIPGLGPALSFTRSYAATRAGTDGPLGYGWTHTYAMSLGIHPGDRGSTLPTATQIDVRQENGAVTTFNADGNGHYTAPARVLATLVRNTDGSFTFTRRQRQLYTFDTTGQLTAIADRNANTLNLTYTGTQLTKVADTHGRFLTLSWTGSRISGVADQAGRSVAYRYSAGGDLLGATDVLGDEATYSYTTGHLVASLTDVRGKTTTNTYDASGRVTAQADPLGRTTTFAYGSGQTTLTNPAGERTIERYTDGQVTSETTAEGTAAEATTSYTYGPTNQPTAVTDPLGKVATMAYDAYGNRLSARDALGRTSSWTYNASGDVLTATDPAGDTSTFTYDTRGNLLTATDPTGAVTRNTINTDGTIATVVDPRGTAAGADPAEHTTSYGYNTFGARVSVTTPTGAHSTATVDALGRTTATVDPRGHEPGADPGDYTTTFTYDATGHQLSVTDPSGAVTTSTYDAAGNPLTVTDATGRTTSYSYDNAGQLISSTDPAGAVTHYTYDGAGRAQQTTDPLGHTTATAYTPAGLPASVTDALGHASANTYDRAGRLLTSTDADGAVTRQAYDDAGQLVTVTDPLGAVTHYAYDSAGRRTSVTDADGRVTSTAYDAAGRPIGQTRNDGSTLAWGYNPAGLLTSYTDAAGQLTHYGYDADGRRTKTTDPLNRITKYAYDAAGNLLSTTKADGSTDDETVTTHTYNRVGRLKTTDYSGPGAGTGATATPGVSFGYDAAGRRTSMADGTGTSAWTYDPAGRLAAHTNGTGATVGYGYDTAGRLTALSYPGGPGGAGAHTVVRAYDNADRLTTVTDWNNQTTGFAWTPGDQLDAITYPNGVVTDYTRDTAGQPTEVRTANGTDLLSDTASTYSPAGLVLTDTGAATGPVSYDYDPLARVNTVTTGTGPGAVAADFGFDPTHNLTTWADGTTQTFDAAAQLAARVVPADPVAGIPAVTTAYVHDGRGNRVKATTDPGQATQTVTHYSYDAADQLTTYNPATGPSTTYAYDGQGLRATKTVGTSGAESFVWDTNSGLPLLLADAGHDYLYGPAGHPYAQIDQATGETQYLHPDRLGSTRAVSDATGTRVASYDYDVYGNPTASSATGSTDTRFRYDGEYTDSETGLQYLRARYYDPTTAAFLTRDPIEDVTGLPYSYTGGNPVLYSDPSGLCPPLTPDWACQKASAAMDKINDGYNAVADSDALQHVSDTAAGFSDTITFGGTNQIRELFGANDAVNKCSGFYVWGDRTGTAVGFVLPVGGSARALRGIDDSMGMVRSVRTNAPMVRRAPEVHLGRQGKHIPGHGNFEAGRSELTADANELAQRAGTGSPVNNLTRGDAGFKERVVYDGTIGVHVARDGTRSPTSVGILHYDAQGRVHIVPGRPIS